MKVGNREYSRINIGMYTNKNVRELSNIFDTNKNVSIDTNKSWQL